MRVITEEVLRDKLRNSLMPESWSELIAECQEIDQLTVTRLRPMSEAPRDGKPILLKYSYPNPTTWVEGVAYVDGNYLGNDMWFADCAVQNQDNFDGWIPLLQYKP